MHAKNTTFLSEFVDLKILQREINSKICYEIQPPYVQDSLDKITKIEIENTTLEDFISILKDTLKTLHEKTPFSVSEYAPLAALVTRSLNLAECKLQLLQALDDYLRSGKIKHKERAESFREAILQARYLWEFATIVMNQKQILQGNNPYSDAKCKYQQPTANTDSDGFKELIDQAVNNIPKSHNNGLFNKIPGEILPLIERYNDNPVLPEMLGKPPVPTFMCSIGDQSIIYWMSGSNYFIAKGWQLGLPKPHYREFTKVTLPAEIKGIRDIIRVSTRTNKRFTLLLSMDNQLLVAGFGINKNFTYVDLSHILEKGDRIMAVRSDSDHIILLVETQNGVRLFHVFDVEFDWESGALRFMELDPPCNSKVKDACFLSKYGIAFFLSEDGYIKDLGYHFPEKMHSICGGSNRCLALSRRGNVYVFNQNDYYILQKKVKILSDTSVHSIFMSDNFVGLVTQKGEVFYSFDVETNVFHPLKLEGLELANQSIHFYSKNKQVLLKVADADNPEKFELFACRLGSYSPEWLPENTMKEFFSMTLPMVCKEVIEKGTEVSTEIGMWTIIEKKSTDDKLDSEQQQLGSSF